MDRDIQEIYQQNLMQEETSRREQEEHKQKEQELTQRMQDLRRALDTARRHLEETKVSEANLQADVERLRRNELRYKKKVSHQSTSCIYQTLRISQYYALKQDIEAAKKTARGKSVEDEDDTLIIF